MITETEAYAGVTDRASHAFGERRTERTKVMYANGGISYVYLCYGVHYLFKIQGSDGSWKPGGNDSTENVNNSTCLATLFLVRSSQILLKDPRDSTLVDNYGVFDPNKRLVEGKDGKMELKKGKELSNCAGKIIQSIKVELEYNSLLGLKKEIKYLK